MGQLPLSSLGMKQYRLESMHNMPQFPDKVEAKCCNCGNGWEYSRGDGLICPWCAADFDAVTFSKGDTIAFFEGQRRGKQ